MSREQQMEHLERQLERLHRQLKQMRERRGRREAPESRPESRRRGRAAVPAPDVLGRALAGYSVAVNAGDDGCGGCIAGAAKATGPDVVRQYELSEGKSAALAELMVRSDVPIRVRPLDNGIEVHAPEGQQCLFEAFVKMIGGGETKEEYELSEGKLKALTKLMVRSDVPIFVSPQSESIVVNGSELEQAIFGAFVTMIDPDGAVTSANDSHAYAEALASMASQYERQAHAQVAQINSLRAAMRALENQNESIERQADRMRDKADRIRDKADETRDKADEYRDKAEELEGDKQSRTLAKAKALMQKAKALQREAESLDDQAAVIEQQAEAIIESAEAIAEQIEEIEELADRGDDD